MNITYIHHSSFLVETDRFYYLFDYEAGTLPDMESEKPIFVLSSHAHGDHYNPEVFSLLKGRGMRHVRAVLSEDIFPPENVEVLRVAPEKEYDLGDDLKLTTLRSTDLGVAFLLQDGDLLIYHAGDLNDWVWEGESDADNEQMTEAYRKQIRLLSETLRGRQTDAAFVVLDPRQGKDYDRGMEFFLQTIPAKEVYPMHFWDDPSIIDTFLHDHPQYAHQIQRTQSQAPVAEKRNV